ncbi:MAG: 50S ribosomal protein L9 [Chloracidobacterium sp.]|nr:50S ribosomal protein L9 [Chloracidobacterium sp.]
MANTTILLREDLEHVGGRGEIVKVRAGYARNYLLPQGLATLATKGNVKQIEQERAALLKKAAIEKATAEAQLEQMEGLTLEFARKAGEHGTLFGSVTSMDIAEALAKKGYEIDRKRVSLRDPIKETGEYSVNVKLHREVTLAVPVIVTAEGGEMPEKPAKEAKKAKKKADEPAAEAPVEAALAEVATMAEETAAADETAAEQADAAIEESAEA